MCGHCIAHADATDRTLVVIGPRHLRVRVAGRCRVCRWSFVHDVTEPLVTLYRAPAP